jgi:two-component system chemotaxis response regulator CheY
MFPSDTKILIVDDMLTMRKLVRKCLNGIGFQNITEAVDGEAAWNEVAKGMSSQSPFQLIISDWNMPKVTGLEFLRKVRSTPETKLVPFILLTAEFDQDQVIEAIKAGLSAYITKPFSMAVLSEKLQSVWTHMASLTKKA